MAAIIATYTVSHPSWKDNHYLHLEIETWTNDDGELHRANQPAFVQCKRFGRLMIEEYYKNGKLHRERGPAVIHYGPGGNAYIKEYWIKGERFNFCRFTMRRMKNSI